MLIPGFYGFIFGISSGYLGAHYYFEFKFVGIYRSDQGSDHGKELKMSQCNKHG
jgi:hypothetical protein